MVQLDTVREEEQRKSRQEIEKEQLWKGREGQRLLVH
jgi:hypothetical protein